MAVYAPPGFIPVDVKKRKRQASPTTATGIDDDVAGLVREPRPAGFTRDVTPQDEMIEDDGFLGRVADITEKRLGKVQRASEEYEQGDITYPELMLRGVGFAGGTFFDIAGEGLLTILSKLTPDEAEDYLKETIVAGGNRLANTETAQQLLTMYGELPQRARDNIGDIIDSSLAMAPKVSKLDAGGRITKSGIEAEKNIISKYVLNQSNDMKEQRAGELGLPKEMQTVNKREQRVLNTVLSLKGVSSSTSRENVMKAINGELGKLTRDIQTDLMGVKQMVSKPDVIKSVTDGLTEAMQAKPIYKSKTFKESRRKVQEAFSTAFREFSGKPTDLIKLRREFDSNVRDLFKGDVHEGNHAVRELVASVRDKINTFAQSVAPEGSDVLTKLQRQHNLLLAKSDLKYNMAREGTILEKTAEVINSHPYMALSAVGGTGAVSQIAGSELGMIGAGVLGAGYGLTRPTVRKAAGAAVGSTIPSRGLLYGVGSSLEDEIAGP